MTGEVISFFDCCPVTREGQLLVEPPPAVRERSITVKETMQTAYTYLEHAARRFTRWITVTAGAVRRFVHRSCQTGRTRRTSLTGVQILRRIAVLRI